MNKKQDVYCELIPLERGGGVFWVCFPPEWCQYFQLEPFKNWSLIAGLLFWSTAKVGFTGKEHT